VPFPANGGGDMLTQTRKSAEASGHGCCCRRCGVSAWCMIQSRGRCCSRPILGGNTGQYRLVAECGRRHTACHHKTLSCVGHSCWHPLRAQLLSTDRSEFLAIIPDSESIPDSGSTSRQASRPISGCYATPLLPHAKIFKQNAFTT
jgi:hypothetical protein